MTHPPKTPILCTFQRTSLALCAALCAVAIVAPTTQAQTQPTPPAPPTTQPKEPPITHIPISITVSGGVSLGAYEAGFLYYMTEVIKRNGKNTNLKMVTGASAGTINSFLTVIQACDATPVAPLDSLFWTTWRDISFDRLFVPEEVRPTGAFSRRAFRETIDRIRLRWNQGLPKSCDVVLGVSATRLHPEPISIRGEYVSLPRSRESFSIRIQGQGPNKPPRVSNYQRAEKGALLTLLPLDDPKNDPFPILEQLSLASSAFPIAFQPEPIATCTKRVERDDVIPTCTPSEAKQTLFIDGGVFDNQPLGTAVDLVRTGLLPSARGWTWKPTPSIPRADPPKQVFFFSLNPEVRAWPDPAANDTQDITKSVFSMSSHLVTSFIRSARSQELIDLFQEHPSMRERIALGRSHFPHASSLLGAFFGFFDRNLREYDYHLGMVDAHLFIAQQINGSFFPTPDTPETELPPTLQKPSPDWSGDLNTIPETWHPFFCIRGILEDRAEFLQACDNQSVHSIRILAQTSLDRLYNQCRSLQPSTVQHFHCKRAASKHSPPLLPNLPKPPKEFWVQRTDEPDFNYMLRLLTHYKYTFQDLQLTSDQAELAGPRIHERIRSVGIGLAETHSNPAQQALISTAIRLFANSVQYVPTHNILYATLGDQVELGFTSNSLWHEATPWLRLHTALSFEGISAMRSSSEGLYGMTLSAGTFFEPIPWNTTETQLRFGTRAGLLLASKDTLFSEPCDRTQTRQHRAACSRLVTEAVVSLSLFSRLRAQVVGTYTPVLRPDVQPYWSISPHFGIQF